MFLNQKNPCHRQEPITGIYNIRYCTSEEFLQLGVLLAGQEARAVLGNMGQLAVTDDLGVRVVRT